MFELLLGLTGCLLAGYWLWSYGRCRDALQPAIYILPMMAYQYVVRPWFLYQNGQLQRFFEGSAALELSALVHLVGVWGFCAGCLPKGATQRAAPTSTIPLSAQARQNLMRIALVLGCIALGLYYYSLVEGGGILKAFGRPKGGGARLASGYFAEAIGLCLPALVLLFLAWRHQRMHLGHWAIVLLLASPYLLTGFLGTRRGPTFMVLGGMAFTWFLVRAGKVGILRVLGAVGFVSLVAVVLFTNRPRLYIGSEQPLDWSAPWQYLRGLEASEGDDYVVATAHIATCHGTGKFGWGRRFLITYLVRPIPKQLWPTKYQDANRWLFGEEGGLSAQDFAAQLGWTPAAGSATGGVADVFREFSWLTPVAMYFYGMFFRVVWYGARTRQGVWILLYVLAASLSIYVPTQSASAVFHRFLFLSVPLVLLWHGMIRPYMRRNIMGQHPAQAGGNHQTGSRRGLRLAGAGMTMLVSGTGERA